MELSAKESNLEERTFWWRGWVWELCLQAHRNKLVGCNYNHSISHSDVSSSLVSMIQSEKFLSMIQSEKVLKMRMERVKTSLYDTGSTQESWFRIHSILMKENTSLDYWGLLATKHDFGPSGLGYNGIKTLPWHGIILTKQTRVASTGGKTLMDT